MKILHQSRYVAAAVFVLSLAWFSLRVERSGMASMYCDPVSQIGAQDDAVYGHEAIAMATDGHWLTPTYLDRYALNKPPLLQWLAAIGVKVFGISAWVLRVPSLLAAALVAALILAMVRRIHPLAVAAGAVLLLVSSHLFYVFSRLCMMDMLLTLWFAAAMFVLARDPVLGRASSFWVFAVCTGAAILTKAAAGFLPLAALLIYMVLAPRDLRPRPVRVMAVFAAAAAVAMPWHLYQLAVHPRWFVAEYILTQHFAVGVAAPPQYSNENHLVFYARRLFLMDPVLTLAAGAALALLLFKRRQRPVLLAWIGATLAGLFAFRYRSAYYLLPLIPALVALAAELLAALSRRGRALALAGLAVCTLIKMAFPSQVWGIPAGAATQLAAAPGLERYCERHRSADLIVVEPDDQFYASDLPLARLRYCMIAAQQPQKPPLDFAWLGVSVSVAQFDELEAWRPVFRTRLESFNLPSDAPVGTVIWAHSPGEVAHLIEAHPDTDFSLPATLLRSLTVVIPHRVVLDGRGRIFLLAPAAGTHPATRPCRL
jgi:4-amino-4-deoxy-L-arabinose transferase-like glycosyltransferase